MHHAERIPPENKAVLKKLPRYILLNPFPVAKMTLHSEGENIFYRSKLNPKINRNFDVFKGRNFLAAITPLIPDKSA